MTIEWIEVRAPSSWLARLRAAIVRFLVKMAFFSGITALGLNGIYWIPIPSPYDPTLKWVDLVAVAAGFCSFCMFAGGLMGLAVTVFTAGRKPRWD